MADRIRLLVMGLAVLGCCERAYSGSFIQGKAIDDDGHGVQAAVYVASPSAGVVLDPSPKDQKPSPVFMRQKDKNFTPSVVSVEVGQSVDFTNEDSVFHNVFSASKENTFDLGLFKSGKKYDEKSKDLIPGGGPAATRVFRNPGKVQVFCNIHPDMVGQVVVVPHRYHATSRENGQFKLPVPSQGELLIKGIDSYGNEATSRIRLPYSGELKLVFKDRKTAAPEHTKKNGKAYPKDDGYGLY